LAVLGIVIGLPASFALTRALLSLLFAVSASDPLTFVSVAILLLLVARGLLPPGASRDAHRSSGGIALPIIRA
jgi:hypothetical protein